MSILNDNVVNVVVIYVAVVCVLRVVVSSLVRCSAFLIVSRKTTKMVVVKQSKDVRKPSVGLVLFAKKFKFRKRRKVRARASVLKEDESSQEGQRFVEPTVLLQTTNEKRQMIFLSLLILTKFIEMAQQSYP